MKEKLNELETLLLAECPKHETDCNGCPFSKECDEYARLKNLIIEQ